MKDTLQLFRARWLLLVTMLLGVLGASAQDTWYLFDSYVADGRARATFTNPDPDGNYVVEYTNSGTQSNNFAFVNSPNPTNDSEVAKFLGSSGNVTITEPGTHDLKEIDYSTFYSDNNIFTIGYGDTWVITFNPTTMKVTFAHVPAPELPETAPATLYLADYVNQFAGATNDGNGIFEFTSVEISSNRYPYYGFCDTPNPRDCTVMASAAPAMYATAADNITIELNTEYNLALSSWDAINDMIGSFIIPEGLYDITVDWAARKVTFKEGTIPEIKLPDAPDTLYLIDYKDSFGEAANDGNGVFMFEAVTVPDNPYPYYGFANSSVPTGADLIVSAVAAENASSTNNITIELDEVYPVALSNFNAINDCWGSYIINPGTYNITLDWIAMTVTFSHAEAKKPDAPDTLYLVDWQNSYGEAANDGNGVFVFEGVSIPENQYPYYGFADNSNPKSAGLILGTVPAEEASFANNVILEYDQEYSAAFSNYSAIDGCVGSYIINPGSYNITVDWNEMTVTVSKPIIEAPDVLYIIDYVKAYGSAINNGSGIYEFEDVVLTSGFPYYGFAPTDQVSSAPWALGTVDYSTAQAAGYHGCNIDVVYGEEYSFDFSVPQAMYDEIGSFVLGTTPVNITLDWEKKTVLFYLKPLEQPSVLYATDTYLEDRLGSCSNNGNGLYNMVVNVTKSSSLVVFTNSTDFKNEEGETIYYGTADGKISNVEFEQAYSLGLSDYATIWADETGLHLPQGRYKIELDFMENTIIVHDISRGDVWTIPETLNVYSDEMEELAKGDKVEEGVFQFNNVTLAKSTNIVFTDNPTNKGKFFGSSMNGDRSVVVKNYKTYELYIPTYQEIAVDGVAGFQVPAGNWNIKVDMNEKNVSFIDPEAVYFPEELVVVADSETTTNTATGESNYIWKLVLPQETAVTFSDPLTGRTYGSPAADVTVANGEEYKAGELAAAELNAFKVPAGTWEAVLDLNKGNIIFYQYQSISLVSSTHNDGDKFYSYFGAGTEPMMTLTFSGNPYTIAEGFLALGDYTPGQNSDTETCKIEKLNVYRSGNTLFTSFAGKVRSIPEGAEPKVTLVISTIKSVHGLLAETEAISGLPAGSLMFTFDFEEFNPIAIESELLDAEGEPMAEDEVLNVDEMETVTLMVKPYNLISFSGVNLTAAVDEEAENATPATVSAKWEAGEEDADGFTPIYVNIPMSIRGSGKWNLTLANLNVDDGTKEHGTEVNYAIESLVHPVDVFVTNPENGSKVDKLQDITITWNHSLVKSIGYKGSEEPVITVTSDLGYKYLATVRVVSELDANQLQIHIENEIVKSGKHTAVIPAGTILLNDSMEPNPRPIVLEYWVTGTNYIDSLIADDPDAEVTVCSVSGIVLRKGRAADVLESLGEGIYIINGVKIHIH